MVRIRDYRSGDREVVLELARRLTIGVAGWRDPAGVERAVVGWVRSSIDGTGTQVLVAEADGGVVGLVTVAQREHWSGGWDAYVGELVVSADAQSRGIGRALMAAAERWARDHGLRRLVLETGAANAGARAFYAALGYAEEDIRLSRQL